MVTTHLGKFCKSHAKIDKIRSIIYNELVPHEGLLNTEVLFYVLVDKISVSPEVATDLALKVHGGGSQVTSAGISSALVGTSHELEQRQITMFMKRHMKSTRIQILKKTPYIWQMNGFSTFEPPFIAGFSRVDDQTSVPVSQCDFSELVVRGNVLKEEINQLNEQLIVEAEATLVIRKNELQSEYDEVCTQIQQLKWSECPPPL